MCLKTGAPEKPKKGECGESHGVTQRMIAEMAMVLTVMMTLSPLMRTLNDRQA